MIKPVQAKHFKITYQTVFFSHLLTWVKYMIGRDFNNGLNTLTYSYYVKLGADAAEKHLAELFGSGTDFNAKRFCNWYQLSVIGNEYWYRSLPCKDQLKVLKLWNEPLSQRLAQIDFTQQKTPCFLPKFTMAEAKAEQLKTQGPAELAASSSISTDLHHKF